MHSFLFGLRRGSILHFAATCPTPAQRRHTTWWRHSEVLYVVWKHRPQDWSPGDRGRLLPVIDLALLCVLPLSPFEIPKSSEDELPASENVIPFFVEQPSTLVVAVWGFSDDGPAPHSPPASRTDSLCFSCLMMNSICIWWHYPHFVCNNVKSHIYIFKYTKKICTTIYYTFLNCQFVMESWLSKCRFNIFSP